MCGKIGTTIAFCARDNGSDKLGGEHKMDFVLTLLFYFPQVRAATCTVELFVATDILLEGGTLCDARARLS